jgi:CheY-like chemotaxis protein
MVFGIIRSHKGRISVTSELGKGTTFTVELPSAAIAAAEPSGAHSTLHASEGSLAGLRILVAEDELDLRDTLADALTVARAQVATAKDGEEAWVLFSQGRFDFVLSDQRMPRATGLDLYRRIRAQDAAVPFILASGQDLEPFRAELDQDPKLRLLPKPFSVARLLELVDQLRT